jgi:hypothetical protein
MQANAKHGGNCCERVKYNMNQEAVQKWISSCYNGGKCNHFLLQCLVWNRHGNRSNKSNIDNNGRMFVTTTSYTLVGSTKGLNN